MFGLAVCGMRSSKHSEVPSGQGGPLTTTTMLCQDQWLKGRAPPAAGDCTARWLLQGTINDQSILTFPSENPMSNAMSCQIKVVGAVLLNLQGLQ